MPISTGGLTIDAITAIKILILPALQDFGEEFGDSAELAEV